MTTQMTTDLKITTPSEGSPCHKFASVLEQMNKQKQTSWKAEILFFLRDWDHWYRVALMSECSEKDVATVLHDMFCDKLHSINTNGKNYTWFEFDTYESHREGETMAVTKWEEHNSPYCIKDALFRNGDLMKEILKLLEFFDLLDNSSDVDSSFTQPIVLGLKEVKKKFLTITYTNHVIEACGHLFLNQHFREKLDSNPDLIGFNNGVFDLQQSKFLPAYAGHYVSKTVGYDFVPADKIDGFARVREEIFYFFQQLFPDEKLRAYVIRSLALFLWGENPEQKFWFYTGEGSNGKSKLLELMRAVLGEYTHVFPNTVLTEKKGSSNQASETMANSRGARLAYMSEIEKDTRINEATLKELTGGDVIRARHLYKESFEFKPCYKMVMAVNDLPNTAVSESVFRRIRVVPFVSLFAEPKKYKEEKKKGKRQEGVDLFPVDMALHTKFKAWRMPLMCILLDEFKAYQKEGLPEPSIVKKATTQYKDDNNFVESFVDSCTTTKPDPNADIDKKTKKPVETHTCLNELWNAFNTEFRDEQKNPKTFTAKKVFQNHIITLWGAPETKKYRGKRIVWKGHRLISPDDEEDTVSNNKD